MTPRQKRAKERRDAHNEAMRALLPSQPSNEERKRRAERVMAAHDAELIRRLGLSDAGASPSPRQVVEQPREDQ